MYLVKRKKIYHFFYHDKEKKFRSISTKCNLRKDAEKFAVEFLNAMKNDRSAAENYTLAEFELYYKSFATTRFTKSYRDFLDHAFKQFKRTILPSAKIKNITAVDIERFIQLKRKEAGDRIINGYLRSLQGAFERAVEFGFIERNVFKEVKKLKPVENPPVFLTRKEFQTLLEYEKDFQISLIYRTAIYTGMRMGELRFLRWSSIDFEKNFIMVKNHEEFSTKSKRSRVIPLHKDLRADLLKLRKEPNDYVFLKGEKVFTKDFLSARFKKTVREAGLNDRYHFHTLRHTFASWLVQNGVSIYHVSKLLGHSDIKTTEIYAHLRSEDLRSVVDTLV
jgi:integrase